MCEVANTVLWSLSATYCNDVALAAASLSCVGALCIAFTLFAEHKHSMRPSTFLSIYLSISFLLDIAKTRTYFLRTDLKAIAIVSVFILLFKLAILVLEEMPKKSLTKLEEHKNTGAEAFSGFWNRAFLVWLNSTFALGYKTILKIDDLQSLPPEILAEKSSVDFQEKWDNRMYRICIVLLYHYSFIFYRKQDISHELATGLSERHRITTLYAHNPSSCLLGCFLWTAISC